MTGAASEPAGFDGEMFSRVSTNRVSAMIVEQIRTLIRDGTLKPGDRLPSERELGERFGVSRVVLREAMRVLEGNGLITIRVGARGGAFVTAPTSTHIGEGIADLLTLSGGITPADVTEARRILEVGYVPLVCERADETDIAELLAICDRADAALAEGNYPVSLSAEFHVRVAQATHNGAIEMLTRSFQGPIVMSLQQAQDHDPRVGVTGAAEHREFVGAVTKRDVTTAQAVMRKHLARTAQRVAGTRRGDREVR
ncbi:FadR/GntR family transcriptional regulator [Mycobacterium intracellulare]|uniref:FadR/GntR family transcriptional regulator n=1 Tax=Mycobacterium intracellulare TaxID=1767 RepID=UPI00334FEBF6